MTASAPHWTITERAAEHALLITTHGTFTVATLITMMEEVQRRGGELNITRFVFDDRLIHLRLTTSEIYALPDALERLGWQREMRVAVVIAKTSTGTDDYKFFASIATSRAFAYSLFDELDPALAWVASDH